MKLSDIEHAIEEQVKAGAAGWDMDNSELIKRLVIPNLRLIPYYKQVLMWMYGFDGAPKSYEMESDGETLVRDLFAGGKIKSPAGVGHDGLNRSPGHMTPDGYVWTCAQTNRFYFSVMRALGYPLWRATDRWWGVTISKRKWWRKTEKVHL